MIPWLDSNTPFPDVSAALTEADGAAGLLAAGADLSTWRLLQAYQRGIFPWYSEGQPILWWSTNPRMVLYTDRFRVSPSLKKTLRRIQKNEAYQVRFDSAFERVVRACAGPRRDGAGTWISEDIVHGYTGLHRIGHAHSAELWRDGALVGGAYGVSIGRMFFGESMFARETDASKVALAYLVHFLKLNGVAMVDCQQETDHLASLGAAPISRADFLLHLSVAVKMPPITDWRPVDPVQTPA
jgi:leucyl/phenylalanyl-tRNA--protein transferase